MAPTVDGILSRRSPRLSDGAALAVSYAAGEAGATTGVPTAGAGVAVLLLQPANAKAKIAAANSTPSFFTRMSVFPPVGVPWASEPGTRRASGHDGRRRAGSRTRALATSPLRRTHGCPQHGTHGEHPAWSMILNGIRDANRCQRPLGDDRWLVARRLRPPARVAAPPPQAGPLGASPRSIVAHRGLAPRARAAFRRTRGRSAAGDEEIAIRHTPPERRAARLERRRRLLAPFPDVRVAHRPSLRRST